MIQDVPLLTEDVDFFSPWARRRVNMQGCSRKYGIGAIEL